MLPRYFGELKLVQLVLNHSRFTIRHIPGPKHQNITAATLLDPKQREGRVNDGYQIYKDIPNTPPYYEKLGRETRATGLLISGGDSSCSWVFCSCTGPQLG